MTPKTTTTLKNWIPKQDMAIVKKSKNKPSQKTSSMPINFLIVGQKK